MLARDASPPVTPWSSPHPCLSISSNDGLRCGDNRHPTQVETRGHQIERPSDRRIFLDVSRPVNALHAPIDELHIGGYRARRTNGAPYPPTPFPPTLGEGLRVGAPI